MVHAYDVALLGVRACPREDRVHGLARGLEGVELERRGMGLEVFFAALGEGEGACVVDAGICISFVSVEKTAAFLREFVEEAEVLGLVAEIDVYGFQAPKVREILVLVSHCYVVVCVLSRDEEFWWGVNRLEKLLKL